MKKIGHKGKRWMCLGGLLLVLLIGFLGYRFYESRHRHTASEYMDQTASYLELKQYDKAIEEATEGLQAFPREAGLYLYKAQAYALLEETDKARGTLVYGYKKTGSEEIEAALEEYPTEDEESASYLELSENGEAYAPGEADSGKATINQETYSRNVENVYTTPTVPEIELPDVTTTQTTVTEAVEESIENEEE